MLLTWRFLQIFDISQIFQFSLKRMSIVGKHVIRGSGGDGGGDGGDDVLNYKQYAANLEVSPDFRHLSNFSILSQEDEHRWQTCHQRHWW